MGRRFSWKRQSYTKVEGGRHPPPPPPNTNTTTAAGPSCVFGLLHFLNYQNVRRVLPHKRHGASSNARHGGGRTHPAITTGSVEEEEEEEEAEHEQLVLLKGGGGGVEQLPDDNKSVSVKSRSSSPNKRSSSSSIKSRIKGAFSSSDKDHHSSKSKRVAPGGGGGRGGSSPAEPSSNTTILLQDSLDQQLEEIKNHPVHPDINKDHSSSGMTQEPSRKQNTTADILEVFKVNKQIFLKILNDDDREDIAGEAAIHITQKKKKKKKRSSSSSAATAAFILTKSGSFPSPNHSKLIIRPTTKLEHKQTEVWPRQMKAAGGIDIFFSEHDDDHHNNSINNPIGGGVKVRRAASLNETRTGHDDRYAQLFDAILNKELRKSLSSRSLKLGSDGEPIFPSTTTEPTATRAASSFRRTRRLSVPDIDYSSLLAGGIIDASPRQPDAAERSADLGTTVSNNHTKGAEVKGSGAAEVVESQVSVTTELAQQQSEDKKQDHNYGDPDSVFAACTQDDQTQPSAPDTQGSQDRIACSSIDDDDDDDDDGSAEETETTPTQREVEVEVEVNQAISVTVDDDNNFKEDDFFYYVKYVLDLIGLTTKEQLMSLAWHTYDQPLSPSLFQEIEETHYSYSYSYDQQQPPKSNSFDSRKLLFDLVNKALVDIDEKSSCLVYSPKDTLSYYNSRRNHHRTLLHEVWAAVVQWLHWKVESNASLDDIVRKDLHGRDDGWMDLRMESECVGLELEDLILDDLLDDLILSWHELAAVVGNGAKRVSRGGEICL